jgi:hypothetical protein
LFITEFGFSRAWHRGCGNWHHSISLCYGRFHVTAWREKKSFIPFEGFSLKKIEKSINVQIIKLGAPCHANVFEVAFLQVLFGFQVGWELQITANQQH